MVGDVETALTPGWSNDMWVSDEFTCLALPRFAPWGAPVM